MTGISWRRRTALAMIAAYNHWNITELLAVRSDDCVHLVQPPSINRAPMNNTQYAAYFATVQPLFRNFNATVSEIFEDGPSNSLVMSASSTADTDIGPYANSYFLSFHFTPAGDKVTRFVEFVDSYYSIDFFRRLAEHNAGGS